MKIIFLLLCVLLLSSANVDYTEIQNNFNSMLLKTTTIGSAVGGVSLPLIFFISTKSEKPVDYIIVSVLGTLLGFLFSFVGTEVYYIVSG